MRPCSLAVLAVALAACVPDLPDAERFRSDASVACGDVQTEIFWRRCVDAGCHAPGQPAAGLELYTDGLAARLVGVEATSCLGELLIDPDAPEQSFLLHRLSPDPRCGGDEIERMPLTGIVLSDEELGCVSGWIERVAAEHVAGGTAP